MYFLHQVLPPPFPPSFLRYVETKTLNVIMLLCYYVMRSLFLSSQRPAPLVSPYYII